MSMLYSYTIHEHVLQSTENLSHVLLYSEYCSCMCTNGTIRLVGGSTPYVGTLEVCVAGCWGTVCGNDFDAKDASVACRQLGLPAFGELSYFCPYNNCT